MSTTLANWQRRFFSALQDDAAAAENLELAPAGRTPPRIGLDIYRHAYRARFAEALASDHPQLGTYLGDALWQQLCERYVAAHPSTVRSLRHFGESLPDFLATNDPFSKNPQCAELARWERRLLDSFDAPDGSRADFAELTSLPEGQWPGLRIRFHPSVQVVLPRFNSVEIWQSLKAGQPPPAPAPADAACWVLWRDRDLVTRYRSLDREEQGAFQHFLTGGDFADLCELMLATTSPAQVPERALARLRRWSDDGWVARWQVVDDLTTPTAVSR